MKKFIILALFIIPSLCLAQDVDLLWKGRAVKAMENLDKLKLQMNKKDTIETRLKIMLESAYGLILIQPDIAVKKTSNVVVYHLVMSFNSDGMLDVGYIYDTSYNYLGIRVDSLPKKRCVTILDKKGMDDIVMVSNYEDNKEPMIAFSKSNPHVASIISNE